MTQHRTPGQIAYETELEAVPTYHDGSPRHAWQQLGDLERSTWEKNPRPRWTKNSPPFQARRRT